MPSSLILHIEDSLADATLLAVAAKQSQIALPILHIDDGEAALDYLRNPSNELPDLILLDLNMPGKSGQAVLREIRADERTSRIAVVILTSSDNVGDVASCYDGHADAYVVKPIGLSGFRDIAKALNRLWFDVVSLPNPPANHRFGENELTLVGKADQADSDSPINLLHMSIPAVSRA